MMAAWQRFRDARSARAEAPPPVRLGGTHYVRHTGSTSTPTPDFDSSLIWVCLVLLCWGVVMVYSATIALPDNPRFAGLSHHHFVLRHSMWIGLSLLVALLAFQVPMSWWERNAPWLIISVTVLLVAVLLVGPEIKGARRWLPLGPLRFQPAELAKIAVVLYVSSYMARKLDEDFWRTVTPLLVLVGMMGGLMLAQPDMGTFIVITVIAMGILFLGGVNARIFFTLAIVLAAVLVVMIWTSEYRRARVFAYLDPWSAKRAYDSGYQLTHSLMAIGRGEVFGVGLGGSIEKLHWLPDAHTDFLLAVIGEEFGLVGMVCIIVTFWWMTRHIMVIGRRAIALDRVFSGLVAQGVAVWLGFQAFINIGVNLGALPTKGLTLPFMSYGGSAIMANMIAIALVLRVEAENQELMHVGRARP
ncbi:MAG: putative lipid II flippase FtsW [Ottowia sp.]|nr:putative lipid II flippase FtsW [Ottowia sp.]